VAAALVLLVASCGNNSGSDTGADAVENDGMVVRGPWTRPTPPGVSEASFYLEIENVAAPDDRLMGGRSDRCFTVHPHITEIDDDGVSRMTSAEDSDLALPTGALLDLAPNGLHLMCVGLDAPIQDGDDISLELVFERHGTIAVEVEVTQDADDA
jgi:copper(I)-binding protein